MLEIRGLTKSFQARTQTVEVLSELDLDIRRGEFVSILGPSGCGKSTLLHLLGGFVAPTSGSILLEGREVTRPGRDRGMVFQNATLFPWRTVLRNISWPLEVAGERARTARKKAREMLELVGLHGFENAYPAEMSGGMNQRAALARTLIMKPAVLLMDEPFGALDAQTREIMQEELLRICHEEDLTTIFVTHDISEAVFLGDRVVTMLGRNPGHIIEDLEIELPRPRGQTIKEDPAMLAYQSRLRRLIQTQTTAEIPSQDSAAQPPPSREIARNQQP